ncbi:hypothetical protein GS432_04105 [Rhodococcus hoagii]|nr:hypothetical protein [Prescottella equi]
MCAQVGIPAVGPDGRPVVPARQTPPSAILVDDTRLECPLQGPSARVLHADGGVRDGRRRTVTVDGSRRRCGSRSRSRGSVLDRRPPRHRTAHVPRRAAAGWTSRCSTAAHGRSRSAGSAASPAARATGDVLGDTPPRATRRPRRRVSGRRAPRTDPHVAPRVYRGSAAVAVYFTDADMTQFYETTWITASHANRTGIRLDGPKPTWSRTRRRRRGVAPVEPARNPYSVGALNVSGDTPILLGPDGPRLGGFAARSR